MQFNHADRISELMKKFGWNQVNLAKKANLTHQQISNILNSRRTKLQLETVEKIAAAFRMTVDEYLGKKKQEKKPDKLHPLTVKLQKLIENIPDNDPLLDILESIIDREIDKEKK